ncbi:SH3 domain-containing protein [Lysinibacillus pakistanensis]|uniref:SH3b domain-containing protein n=1 Tax=Lysinibacillus pakistanensis TaxID=759811 RepID=A0AAX3WZM3_9BACI|nr:SH3 domain-containing protein [Lysinibacillus pakistanensis]MDM5232644.1 hypothetical protein [Lysinibacillus pakistanensis]WHY48149.1 hypothetical protein QNH22_07935 [Lysinibacillus pakistanensis]WHY53161.1 hypothetical protein QNH24_07920 [Lysinibacillus pakistanensis]
MNILKKMSVVVFLLVMLFSIQQQVAEATNYRIVKVVNDSSLLVRDSPSDVAKSIGNLTKGEFVTEFSSSKDWSHIQVGDIKGYVISSSLSIPQSTIKIANSKSGLVVKSKPSTSASTLATLKFNMIVEDFGSVENGWSFVQYGNVVGYVKSDFIGNAKTTTKYVNTRSGVIVRNIASPSGVSVGSLSNGTQVTVHATLVGWSYVTANNVRGYVEAAYLGTKKPTESTSTSQKSTYNTFSEEELEYALLELEYKKRMYPTHANEYRDALEEQLKIEKEKLNRLLQKEKELRKKIGI